MFCRDILVCPFLTVLLEIELSKIRGETSCEKPSVTEHYRTGYIRASKKVNDYNYGNNHKNHSYFAVFVTFGL